MFPIKISHAVAVNIVIFFSVDVFLNIGVRYVTLLAEANQYDAIFRIISNLVPMFSNCPEKLAHDRYDFNLCLVYT